MEFFGGMAFVFLMELNSSLYLNGNWKVDAILFKLNVWFIKQQHRMKACFQDFLDVILGKRANEGKGGMLEIAILILQDISNVMLGTTFLAMPPPDICLHARLQGVKELQVAMMNIIIIIWCCYTSLLMRASDALKTNIFLSTIGNVRERRKSSITTYLVVLCLLHSWIYAQYINYRNSFHKIYLLILPKLEFFLDLPILLKV